MVYVRACVCVSKVGLEVMWSITEAGTPQNSTLEHWENNTRWEFNTQVSPRLRMMERPKKHDLKMGLQSS